PSRTSVKPAPTLRPPNRVPCRPSPASPEASTRSIERAQRAEKGPTRHTLCPLEGPPSGSKFTSLASRLRRQARARAQGHSSPGKEACGPVKGSAEGAGSGPGFARGCASGGWQADRVKEPNRNVSGTLDVGKRLCDPCACRGAISSLSPWAQGSVTGGRAQRRTSPPSPNPLP